LSKAGEATAKGKKTMEKIKKWLINLLEMTTPSAVRRSPHGSWRMQIPWFEGLEKTFSVRSRRRSTPSPSRPSSRLFPNQLNTPFRLFRSPERNKQRQFPMRIHPTFVLLLVIFQFVVAGNVKKRQDSVDTTVTMQETPTLTLEPTLETTSTTTTETTTSSTESTTTSTSSSSSTSTTTLAPTILPNGIRAGPVLPNYPGAEMDHQLTFEIVGLGTVDVIKQDVPLVDRFIPTSYVRVAISASSLVGTTGGVPCRISINPLEPGTFIPSDSNSNATAPPMPRWRWPDSASPRDKWASTRLARPGKDLPFVREGNSITFTLPGLGNYYFKSVSVSNTVTTTLLILVDDLDALQNLPYGRPGFIDVTTLGVVPNLPTLQTDAVQIALSRILPGQTAVFPPGLYKVKFLILSSNFGISNGISIYLAPGAILQGDGDWNPGQSHFILLDGISNIRLTGWGCIDAGRTALFRQLPPGVTATNMAAIRVRRSTNFRLDGLLVMGNNGWGIHFQESRTINMTNVREWSGVDGVDPDASWDVHVQDNVIISNDDSIAVKNRYPTGTFTSGICRNILVARNIMLSTKSVVKIGTETEGPILNVTFINNDCLEIDRGVVISALDGGLIRDVSWIGTRMWMSGSWPDTRTGTAIEMCTWCSAGKGRVPSPTPVENMVVSHLYHNLITSGLWDGTLEYPIMGNGAHWFINVEDEQSKSSAVQAMDRIPIIRSTSPGRGYHGFLDLKNVTIGWNGFKTSPEWSGTFAEVGGPRWITTDGVVEVLAGSIAIPQWGDLPV